MESAAYFVRALSYTCKVLMILIKGHLKVQILARL
jgi:hypothetical protein